MFIPDLLYETVGLKRFDLIKWIGSGEGPQKKEDNDKKIGWDFKKFLKASIIEGLLILVMFILFIYLNE